MNRFMASLAAALVSLSALAQSPMTGGEVTKIDKATGRVTLKHEGIKHLDMPPMSMVFRVRDTKLLDGVAVGDRVRFAADRIDGNFTLTAIAKGP